MPVAIIEMSLLKATFRSVCNANSITVIPIPEPGHTTSTASTAIETSGLGPFKKFDAAASVPIPMLTDESGHMSHIGHVGTN